MRPPSLSVLVPVYNEAGLVAESLGGLARVAASRALDLRQVVVVDDGSRDGSAQAVEAFLRSRRRLRRPGPAWVFLRHGRNRGKGAAIRSALARARGEVSVIHDADLEYDPRDLPRLLQPFRDASVRAVYGSRFLGRPFGSVSGLRHEAGNRALTFLSNRLTPFRLSDMETCYKALRTGLFRELALKSDDFRVEVEITLKLGARGVSPLEVPIAYAGRKATEGKKITWRDGLKALAAMARYRPRGGAKLS